MEEGSYGAQRSTDIYPTGNVDVDFRRYLLGHGVELYLDDCIVYGATEEEFKANLRAVFERFRNRWHYAKPEEVQVWVIIHRICGTHYRSGWYTILKGKDR